MSTSIASPISIERNALYELVWQEPMTKIAPRFGLSDVGLAKACKPKHQRVLNVVGSVHDLIEESEVCGTQTDSLKYKMGQETH